jgi:hypothetical protein
VLAAGGPDVEVTGATNEETFRSQPRAILSSLRERHLQRLSNCPAPLTSCVMKDSPVVTTVQTIRLRGRDDAMRLRNRSGPRSA